MQDRGPVSLCREAQIPQGFRRRFGLCAVRARRADCRPQRTVLESSEGRRTCGGGTHLLDNVERPDRRMRGAVGARCPLRAGGPREPLHRLRCRPRCGAAPRTRGSPTLAGRALRERRRLSPVPVPLRAMVRRSQGPLEGARPGTGSRRARRRNRAEWPSRPPIRRRGRKAS